MDAIRVKKLSDGEELVVEVLPERPVVEDPRERAIEGRRLAEQGASREEPSPRGAFEMKKKVAARTVSS